MLVCAIPQPSKQVNLMFSRFRLSLVLAASAYALLIADARGAAGAMTWNPAADWGNLGVARDYITRNPNGDWTFGESDTPGQTVLHATDYSRPWPGFLAFVRTCLIGKNLLAEPVFVPPDKGGAWIGSGQMAFDAGDRGGGKTAVLRWTATCSARVSVRAVFTGNHIPVSAEDPGTISRVHVYHGDKKLWEGRISGFIGCASPQARPRKGTSPVQAYSGAVSVRPGETIDFECDFSQTPQGACRGLTGLEASVTVVRFDPPADGQPAQGWADALKPRGAVGEEIALAYGGRPSYVILLPSRPDPKEQKAASDLQRWLCQMTGAEFPIELESSLGKPPSHCISIGNTRLLGSVNLPLASRDLGADGYAIIQHRDCIFLRGGSRRGPINAVYALLEEDLGCRWYDRFSASIPYRPTLKLRPITRSYVPQLDVRDPFIWYAFEPNWSLRNRTNAPWCPVQEEWGGTTGYALFVHSLNWLMNPDIYFKDHPDYYALRGGKRISEQPCLTNPAVLPIVVEAAKKRLREAPDSEIISISYMDNDLYCECPACKASDERYNKSGTLLNFANAVADAIKAEFPNVKVSALAYWGTFAAPRQVRPRDNVVVQLCTDKHAFRRPFFYVTETEDFQEAMRGWCAIGARTYIWDYVTNYSNYNIPMPNMQVCDYNYEFFLKHHASGIMTQGAYQSPGSDNGQMRAWVWAKKLWDPSLKTIDLMRDFVFGYYREAAQPMWDYNMLLWDIWQQSRSVPRDDDNPLALGIWFSPDAAYLSKEFMGKAQELMAQAEGLARTPETRRRVALAKYTILHTVLCQELGFLGGGSMFVPGKSLYAADKSRLRAILAEFEQITNREGVTRLAESGEDVPTRINRWRNLLDLDLSTTRTSQLSNSWKFRQDEGDAGVREAWFAPALDDSGWADVRSDKDCGWEKQGFPDYIGLGWYRQRFTAPDEFADAKHVYLYFGGVDEEGWIYLNGAQVFERSAKSTDRTPLDLWDKPFAFDAKPFLKFGQENTLAVRVNNVGAMGGVWRPVHLVASDIPITDVNIFHIALKRPQASP